MMSATFSIECNFFNLKDDATIRIFPAYIRLCSARAKGVSISQHESGHTEQRRHTSLPINRLPSLSLAALFREV